MLGHIRKLEEYINGLSAERQKLAEQKERSVQFKGTQSLSLSSGKNKFAMSQTAELTIVESFSPKRDICDEYTG